MSSHIPTEIVIDILARLPVKTLIRFTPVCKLWYSIITNPNFITTHLNRSSKKNADQLLLGFWQRDFLLLPDDEEIMENHIKLGFPLGSLSGRFNVEGVVGSCNGLVCLRTTDTQRPEIIIIWNPSIRKSVTLSLPEKPQKQYISVLLFGFVSEKGTYKLVSITYGERRFDKHDFGYREAVEVEVYEQGGEREWRAIRCAPPLIYEGFHCPAQVFLHGAVHWLMYSSTERISTFQNIIAVFEMTFERFKEIALPPDLLEKHPACLVVNLFKGSLAVLCEVRFANCAYPLWVMKEYGVFESWTNLYNIVIPSMSSQLGFRKNGEILIKTDTGAVVSYDFETKTVTNTNVNREYSFSPKVHNYIESLVLFEGEKTLPGLFANLF